MPKWKKPHVARPEEVRIRRQKDAAIIEFLEPGISTTHLTLGPDVAEMTDQEILDALNDTIRAQQRAAAEYKHVAIEIPSGRPQVRYFSEGDQWVPRGDVLRCIVSDGGPGGEAVIEIDDRDFSLQEFGRMLTTYAGWGMRICFVPDNELTREPQVEVREPEDELTA